MIDVIPSLFFVPMFIYLNWRLAHYVWRPETRGFGEDRDELAD